MAPKEIDYSKTCMYRIVCNDLTIKECYVGHTTDFRKRKAQHKSACINANNKNYNFKLYQFIRDHGGWDNWNMLLIEKYPCNDGLEASQRERYWVEQFNATLNTNIPSRTIKQYFEDNRETIAKQQKKYKEENKASIVEYMKQYRQENKESKSQYMKQHYKKNKESIVKYQKQYHEQYNAKNKERINKKCACECGYSYTHQNKARHEKSAKHMDYMENRLQYTIRRGLDLIKKLDNYFNNLN